MPSNVALGTSVVGKGSKGAAALHSFESMFKGKLDAKPSKDAGASDPTAQIAALLQSGMPLTQIIDKIANIIASLHPPGKAPPVPRAGDARKAEDAGQQNDIAGNILDAKSAKDIPAQAQEQKPKLSPLDAGSLARSIMAQVAAALAPQQSASLQAASPAPQIADVPNQPPEAVSETPDAPQLPPNAPDLLARMIVRAATVDAQINGNVAAAVQVDPKSDAQAPTVAALAERFAAALEGAVAKAAPSSQSQGGFNWSSFGRNLGDAVPAEATHAENAPQFSIGLASTLPQTAQAIHTTPVALSTPVDAHAIVEQLVKSMVMRTDAQGTSEIRLHLSPAHLGDLSMKITVQGGAISASVVAQNADVRHALVTNQHHLARSLAEAGLSLAGFSVDVSGGDAGTQQNRDRTAGFGRRYVVHELGGVENEPEPATISSLGPTLLPATSLGLFNYLA